MQDGVPYVAPDPVLLIDRETGKFAVAQPNGSDIVKTAPVTKNRNLQNWLPAFFQ